MRTVLIFSVIFSLLVAAGCKAKVNSVGNNSDNTEVSDTGKAVISFSEYEHDFGKVEAGEKIGCFFTYTNSGSGSLVINSVSTSCGCTVPKYDKRPLPPGKSGTLEVIFNTAGYSGVQSKTVTIQSNASTPVVIVKIMAEVLSESSES
jgi:hypothetical protein